MFIIVCVIIIFLVYLLYPSIYFKVRYKIMRKKKGKVLYLTFDDGPSVYTEKLLDLLKKYNIKASFFCVAKSVLKYKDIVIRMKKEGHLVGLHSLEHKNFLLMSSKKTNKDFFESLVIMEQVVGDVKFFRPPWGHLNWSAWNILKKSHLKPVFWHVMAEDWEDISVAKIKMKLLKRIKGGDIICLHDGRGKNDAPLRTIQALEEVLPSLIKDGYVFERVDET